MELAYTEPVSCWMKSSYSGGEGNCVEIAMPGGDRTAVRDSKALGGSALVFGAAAWCGFLEGIRRSEA